MIFADMGEGRIAPGVAPAGNRRQANGMVAYGTGAGLMPALPPNFAAVNVSEGDGGGSSGSRTPQPKAPTTVVLPTRSTTLPSTMTALTTLSTGRSSGLKTTSYPQVQTFPGPPPQAPSQYPTGPSDASVPPAFVWPGMEDVGAAAAGGATKAGQAAGGPTSKMSTGMLLAIAGVATIMAGTGLYVVLRHR